MSEVIDQVIGEFVAARAASVQRGTFERDRRVMDEVRAALEAVERAGGGVTSLVTRQVDRPRNPWDGPFTDLDVDLMRAAVTAVLVAPRLAPPGACVNTLKEVEVVLRQLGRWLCTRKSLGLNALTLGLHLVDCPAPFTWATRERDRVPDGRPQLRLVHDRVADHRGLAAAGT